MVTNYSCTNLRVFSYNVVPSEFMFRIFPINGMLVNLGPGGIPLSSYSSARCFTINTNSTARRTLLIVMQLRKSLNTDAMFVPCMWLLYYTMSRNVLHHRFTESAIVDVSISCYKNLPYFSSTLIAFIASIIPDSAELSVD